MLRQFLDRQLQRLDRSTRLQPLRPLLSAIDNFLYETDLQTSRGPHIRDSVDLKRWMTLVLLSLMPAILMAIWNSGLQSFVYHSASPDLMEEYLSACQSFKSYLQFALKEERYRSIIALGLDRFLPMVLVSYTVGGFVELLFACLRKHEIAEGFLVTGILFPLVLPPTLPLWMVAVGVAAGITLSKELFGGTGMNIFNPALVCRCLLFFAYPSRMSGDLWVAGDPTQLLTSLKRMNQGRSELDGYSQTTPLAILNLPSEIARIQVDAIAANTLGLSVPTYELILAKFAKWKQGAQITSDWLHLNLLELKAFITAPLTQGGLGLAADDFQAAYDFAKLKYGIGHFTDGTLFFGNHPGSFGETSVLACLLGAIFLIITRVGSCRTMLGVVIGALATAQLFNWGAHWIGPDAGAWNPAKYTLPAYKHLMMGGLAFGLVFMATDPVSSPGLSSARYLYGALIGTLTILIRVINPAYPEGMMLAILCANAFAPLLEHHALTLYRRRRRGSS